jgi:hypothetical protein
MEHGVCKSGVSKFNVSLEAEGVIYANFTTGIETGGSFMASGHLKLSMGSMVATTGCHS